MKWKAEKKIFLMVCSYLKNNKNPRSYRCSNRAKNRVFRTFRLGLLVNLTWWSNSEPGFSFYAKNYFGNHYWYFYNNRNLIFCRSVLLMYNSNWSTGQGYLKLNKWKMEERPFIHLLILILNSESRSKYAFNFINEKGLKLV